MAIGSSNLGMGIVFTLTDRVSATARRISGSIKSMNNTIKTSSASIVENFDAVSGSFMAVAGTTASLVAPFALATKKSAEFRAQMSDVGAKTMATNAELEKLANQALELSSAQGTAQFTAKQVGEGMSFLAMAGFSTEQIMASVADTMMLASAGNLSLAESADIASNVMAQFQLQASDMARVTDVLAFASVKSNTSVSQLGDAMKFFAPTVNALGVEIEEATAATMLLANAGLQGSLGTRALGTSLGARLTKPTKEAAKMMKQLSFDAFDTQGNFIGLIEMVRRFTHATENLTPKMRSAAIATIFGGESIQEMNILMGQQVEVMQNGQKEFIKGADAIAHFTKANQEAAGTARRIAGQQLDNLKGDITVLLSSLDTALIRVGDALTPVLRPLVQTLSGMASAFGAFVNTELGSFLVKATAGIAAFTAGLVLLNFTVNILGKSFMGMAKAAITAMIPLAPLIIAIGLIGGAIYGLIKGIESFKGVMAGTEQPAKGFMGFLQKIGGVTMGIVEIFKTWNGETFVLSQSMRDALERTGALQFFQSLASYITRAIELSKAITKGFMEATEPIRKTFSEAFDSIIKAITSVMKHFGGTNKSLDGMRKRGFTMGQVLGNAFRLILAPLEGLVWLIGKVADGIAYVSDNFNSMVNAFSEGWATVKLGFSEMFGSMGAQFEEFKQGVSRFADMIIGMGSKMKEAGIRLGNAIANGIKSSLANLKSMFAQAILQIFGNEIGTTINSRFGISAEDTPVQPIAMGNGMDDSMARIANANAPIITGSNTTEKVIEREKARPVNVTLQVGEDVLASKMYELDEFNEALDEG